MANILWCLCDCQVEDARLDPLTGKMNLAVRLLNGKEVIEKVTRQAVAYSKQIKDSALTQYQIANFIMTNLQYDQLASSENVDEYLSSR